MATNYVCLECGEVFPECDLVRRETRESHGETLVQYVCPACESDELEDFEDDEDDDDDEDDGEDDDDEDISLFLSELTELLQSADSDVDPAILTQAYFEAVSGTLQVIAESLSQMASILSLKKPECNHRWAPVYAEDKINKPLHWKCLDCSETEGRDD